MPIIDFISKLLQLEATKHLHKFIIATEASELREFDACLTMLRNWAPYILTIFTVHNAKTVRNLLVSDGFKTSNHLFNLDLSNLLCELYNCFANYLICFATSLKLQYDFSGIKQL